MALSEAELFTGVWFLSTRRCGSVGLEPMTIELWRGGSAQTYHGIAMLAEGHTIPLTRVSLCSDPSQSLAHVEFSFSNEGHTEWFRATMQEGILIGRWASDNAEASRKPDWAQYRNHVTGWSRACIDRDTVPRVFDITIGGAALAILRVDRARNGHFLGRLKVYASTDHLSLGEELEYDLDDVEWEGSRVSFTRRHLNRTEYYVGFVEGRTITGTYLSNLHPGKSIPWHGHRAQVLSYGLVARSPDQRALWQQRARRQLCRLLMGGQELMSHSSAILVQKQISSDSSDISREQRDDNPSAWPRHYDLSELRLVHTLQDPCGGAPLTRECHAYLATPVGAGNTSFKYPAAVVLNGHRGSAWQMMNPDLPTVHNGKPSIYWYGDSLARRGYVVLAIDMSHRDNSELYGINQGDDPTYGNGARPPILTCGSTTSDWEENGERAWDVIRALDYLLSLPHVDATRTLITGLSMGGEISTLVGALDPRVSVVVPAGYSPDLAVMEHRRNHPCWRWINANAIEYIDISDLLALIAPRPLIIQTGKRDCTYSSFTPPFASDKQVVRRAREAYQDAPDRLIHYLHEGAHEYCVGDVSPANPSALLGIRVPSIAEPNLTRPETRYSWQTDGTTELLEGQVISLLELIGQFLGTSNLMSGRP